MGELTSGEIAGFISEDLVTLASQDGYGDKQWSWVKPYLGNSILELGAGIGTHTERILRLHPKEVVSVEKDPTSCTWLKARFGDSIHVVEADLDEGITIRKIRDRFAIDTVVAISVLEHIRDDQKLLAELCQMLPPGGRIILLVPAHAILWSDLDLRYGHYRRYNKKFAVNFSKHGQVAVLKNEYKNFVGFVGWYLFAKRCKAKKISPNLFRIYNRLMPVLDLFSIFGSPPVGMTLQVVLEKLDKSNSHCLVCGSADSLPKYIFNRTTIFSCKRCSFLWQNRKITENELRQVYDENYFSNPKLTEPDSPSLFGYVDYVYERFNKQKSYKKILKKIEWYLSTFESSGRRKLLDYGCGLGYFMESAREHGFDATGIEFNQFAIDSTNKGMGAGVCYSDSWKPPPASFGVVSALDVIEHFVDPIAKLREFHRLLEKKGLLVIITVDARSFISRLLGKRLEDFRRIEEHLFFFSKKNIAKMLNGEGFTVLSISSIGHTFELEHLFRRLIPSFPLVNFLLNGIKAVCPKLLKCNIYINLGTKMLVIAQKT